MTDVISTVQNQDPGSELVVLYELDYGGSQPARFFGGAEEEGTPNNLLSDQNMLPWQTGSGNFASSGGTWLDNGTTAENIRSLLTDPFGGESVIWRAINSGANDAGNADGGFHSPQVKIDPAKTYRFSLFINQKNSTNGTTYFGLNAYNASAVNTAVTYIANNNNTSTNPYFWSGDLPTLDKWYLLIAYLVPHTHTGDTIHPDSGVWDPATGKKVNISQGYYDFKFQSTHDKARIRAYQYYNTAAANDEVHFFAPRIDLVDHTMPSVQDLLSSGNPPSEGVVYFRDSTNISRGYTSIPIIAEGFDVSSDGAYSRPELSIGNIGDSLSDAIGGLDYEDLIGKRVTRIITFKKYLSGEASDSATAPGVCLPKTSYIIDRIKSKSILQVTFELAAPFDLAGIQLPRRVVVGGACSWNYQQGRESLPEADRVGGCSWEGYQDNRTAGVPIYISSDDEYILNFEANEALAAPSTTVVDKIYFTEKDSLLILEKGGIQTPTTSNVKEYWQAIKAASSGVGTPNLDNPLFRRVVRYSTYNASTTYYGYSDPRFNDYVLENGKLWRVRKETQVGGAHDARVNGDHWIQADICNKTLESCRLRFHATSGDVAGYEQDLVKSAINNDYNLPFGGFPGVQQKR